ncbi:hypothetical protein Q7P37_004379 [Cladosporium fusiforme]
MRSFLKGVPGVSSNKRRTPNDLQLSNHHNHNPIQRPAVVKHIQKHTTELANLTNAPPIATMPPPQPPAPGKPPQPRDGDASDDP